MEQILLVCIANLIAFILLRQVDNWEIMRINDGLKEAEFALDKINRSINELKKELREVDGLTHVRGTVVLSMNERNAIRERIMHQLPAYYEIGIRYSRKRDELTVRRNSFFFRFFGLLEYVTFTKNSV